MKIKPWHTVFVKLQMIIFETRLIYIMRQETSLKQIE